MPVQYVVGFGGRAYGAAGAGCDRKDWLAVLKEYQFAGHASVGSVPPPIVAVRDAYRRYVERSIARRSRRILDGGRVTQAPAYLGQHLRPIDACKRIFLAG